jgi:hypothetical protein
VTATVTPSKLEQMRQALADYRARLEVATREYDEAVAEEWRLRQEHFIEDPLERKTGFGTLLSNVQDRMRKRDATRAELVKLIAATEPVLAREEQADTERRNAGLIKLATKGIDEAFDGLESRFDEVLDWWESTCLDKVEVADRTAAYEPHRTIYASLMAYVEARIGAAHRPRITRLVGAAGYRAHGAGSWGQPIHGSASVPDGWVPATGFGNAGAFPIVQQAERDQLGQEHLAAAAAGLLNDAGL